MAIPRTKATLTMRMYAPTVLKVQQIPADVRGEHEYEENMNWCRICVTSKDEMVNLQFKLTQAGLVRQKIRQNITVYNCDYMEHSNPVTGRSP